MRTAILIGAALTLGCWLWRRKQRTNEPEMSLHWRNKQTYYNWEDGRR